MTVSVMITTRNRADDLARTLEALGGLRPPPDEILVTLDGCTDGSAELLRCSFPAVKVTVNAAAAGSVPSRDRMMRAAQGDLVLSLDDDSYPVESDFLVRATAIFARAPRLAVLAFPQRSDEFPASLTQSDFGPDQLIASYPSSGAILRREMYLRLAGYASLFGHMYEEPDFALQCVAAGLEVRLCTALTIRHHYSSRNRNEIRIHHLHARNEQWSVVMRCPAPWWPLVSFRRALGQLGYAVRRGPAWIVREPLWWLATLGGVGNAWRERRPVSWSAYQLWRQRLRAPEPISAPS